MKFSVGDVVEGSYTDMDGIVHTDVGVVVSVDIDVDYISKCDWLKTEVTFAVVVDNSVDIVTIDDTSKIKMVRPLPSWDIENYFYDMTDKLNNV